MVANAMAGAVSFVVSPVYTGEPVQPASFRYQTAAHETFSITRVSFLLSDFAFQRADGSWLELTNSAAWLDLDQKRSSFTLPEIPPGEYRSVRFLIGLDTNLNHADVSQFPAGHPLNPNLNGLHWSWQGGFIFLALEGLWRNQSGEMDGWAFHLARDTNSAQVSLAVPLALTNESKIELAFDIATLLNAPRAISFAADGTSTHSRDGDELAAALKGNLPGAFTLRRVTALTDQQIAAAHPRPLYLPAKFTPYPFTISSTFPVPTLPLDNPLIVERVQLGEKLFNETALSCDGSISCSSCHKQKTAFSDPRRFSLGVRDQLGKRNAMPLVNLAWKSSFFWDGRAPSLRAQSLIPIQDHSEMDESLTNVVSKLAADAAYGPAFAAAFGSPEITAEKISLAIEQFVMTLTSFDSKFDRVLRGEESFSEAEKRGFELFSTEYDPRRGQYGADCFHCHGGPLFQSQSFANNGLDETFADPGRAKISGREQDAGKFAVPSLRNVALTAPYMHDGRFKTLDEVIEHYSSGVKRSATLDPNLAKHPDGGVPLTPEDKRALVAFLKTLTDAKYR